MSRVDVEKVSKAYGATKALDDVSISFEDGEFFGLLGPSGSGKSTLLRSIAGFIVPDTGTIRFDGAPVERVPVHKRGIGMVFQSYALFPHLTVAENIAFGLSVRGEPVGGRVEEMLALVQLRGFEARKPKQLSGGQQQRVALARALITRPKVLLLDEPLGALDRRLRQEMQVELKDIQRETGVTTIFVTHDQEEALTLSDRIAIIRDGRIVELGAPQAVYERPKTAYSAQFLGDANLLSGDPVPGGLRLEDGTVVRTNGTADRAAIVRPEKVTVAPRGQGVGENRIDGDVLQAIYSGASVTYRIASPAFPNAPMLAFAQNQSGALIAPGTPVTVSWAAEHTIPVAL